MFSIDVATSKTKLVVYASDTQMTLKQGQGHEIYNKLVDPKQVIIMQSLNSVCERAIL